MDALLAAYRVGARVAWREMARAAAEAGVGAATMAQFAELVFAYIDELSASSVAGHTDELSTSGRVRERYRERLGQHLLAGANLDVLTAAAERAGWPVPVTLTAVLLPAAQVRGVLASLGPDTVQVGEDLPGAEPSTTGSRSPCCSCPTWRRPGAGTCSGCSTGGRPWSARPGPGCGPGRRTTGRPDRGARPRPARGGGRRQRGAPRRPGRGRGPRGAGRPPGRGCWRRWPTCARRRRERLAETLRSWLLHQGRRDEVAAELHVHAQTVRYRMGQLRELYGDRLDDPRTVLEVVVALHGAATAGTGGTVNGWGGSS